MKGFFVSSVIALLLSGLLPSFISAQESEIMTPTIAVRRAGISNFVSKCVPSAELTVAYFGASVTNGAGASSDDKNWRRLVHAWIEKTWPLTTFKHQHVVNGGTGSQLGACRLQNEVLKFKPALVFVEFSVNDFAADPIAVSKSMEGIIRQIRRADPTCDVVMLHTLNNCTADVYKKGEFPPTVAAYERVAAHYNVPTINLSWVASWELNSGKMTWEEFSIDTVHPTDRGYKLFADTITNCFDEWRQNVVPQAHVMPEPMFEDNWEDARLVAASDCELNGGWEPEPEMGGWFPHFAPMMRATKPGDSLKFRFKGSYLGLYHAVGPDSGTVDVLVDDASIGVRDLWDPWCSYYRSNFSMLAENLENKEHDVEVRILPQKNENSTGTALHLGFICIKGELVK